MLKILKERDTIQLREDIYSFAYYGFYLESDEDDLCEYKYPDNETETTLKRQNTTNGRINTFGDVSKIMNDDEIKEKLN